MASDKDKLLLETTQLSSDRDNLKQQINDLNHQISELQHQQCRLASEVVGQYCIDGRFDGKGQGGK